MKTYLILLVSHLAFIALLALVFNTGHLEMDTYIEDFAILSIFTGILDHPGSPGTGPGKQNQEQHPCRLLICAGILFIIGFFSWSPVEYSR